MFKLVRKLFITAAIIASLSISANAEMFGHGESKFEDIKDFKKWKEVVKKNEMDMIVNDTVTSQWAEALAPLNSVEYSKEQKIAAVNSFVNQSLSYAEDSEIWGKSDYWASPTEAFTKGFGDCEDYATAKYFSLKMLGFTDDEMRIVVLKDTRKNQLHAILVVNSNDKNYVLDNQLQDVKMDTQIAYYMPIYSINAHNWWKYS
jgi:predicted transglutaminase-like cysteine proteinase